MEPQEERLQLKQKGLEQAAAIWETLENLPQPIDPVNIYKAACSAKCAEFLSRIRHNTLFDEILGALMQFLDGTLKITGDVKSDKDEGMRVIDTITQAMPLTDDVFNDPAAYATRQHVYDGIIMLSAAKMGKEAETKECIDLLQASVARAMVIALLKAGFTDEPVSENG